MAEIRTITIREVEARTTPSTGKAYWRVKTDSGTYFVWEKSIAEQLQPGMSAVVSTNGSAEYPKITAVHEAHVTAASAADPAVDPAPAAEPPSVPSERERRMLRMSALRAAADVLHGSHVPAGEIIEYAEQLLMWLES
jgi:hypothetical protein